MSLEIRRLNIRPKAKIKTSLNCQFARKNFVTWFILISTSMIIRLTKGVNTLIDAETA